MFCKATLLTVALALLASANPVAREPTPAAGLRIPLHRPRSLKDADGVFDHAKAVQEIVKTKNKHRRNLIALEQNVGRQAFPEGAEIKPLATVPASFQKRGAVTLKDQNEDTEWTGKVEIGSPAQSFVIDFDTGSSDLWVPSSSCKSCSGKTLYNPSKSSNSSKKSGSFSISYGDGSTASGTPYTDDVTVGGVKVTGQYFAAVTTESSQFAQDPADGLLGLAFPAISNLKHDPFFFTAVKQGTVKDGEFSFKLASSGSELFVGGRNVKLFSGAVEFHPVSNTNTGFWQIGGASVSVGGKTAVSKFDTVIDSGSTIMTAPADAAAAFWKTVKGSQVFDEEQGLYSFPCASVPQVAFSWGGKSWAISADDFNLGMTEQGSKDCVGALAAGDIGLGKSTWLLGDTLMKNVYTVFSTNQTAVGFAKLA
ncbi:Aspartic protease [Trametes pubescens]|uniref:Aspartic protease n=1 Tax=Trametes pubescens TaxID=154538 RepID=A0A1M2W4C8_TRAPU|nr:Aspartic protease [Trametes pubescens]